MAPDEDDPSEADHVADLVLRTGVALEAVAVADDAPGMRSYMKDQFPYLGAKTPARRAAFKPIMAEAKSLSADGLLELAEELFAQPEREFAYCATDLLRRWSDRFRPEDLPRIRRIVETKPWWDTVDALAVHTVGSVVRAHRSLQDEMDRWVADDNVWIARTAILHQLLWKADTDAERLFRYCDLRAGDTEFFIRKALGWALRHYARTDPDAVRSYVEANEAQLSALTKREALKHLGPGGTN